MSDNSKISKGLRTLVGEDGDATYQVVIVLNVPKPDLSHVFGTSKSKQQLADPTLHKSTAADAQRAIEEIISRSNGTLQQRLENASSIVAVVDADTIKELERSEHVIEILENQRLR